MRAISAEPSTIRLKVTLNCWNCCFMALGDITVMPLMPAWAMRAASASPLTPGLG